MSSTAFNFFKIEDISSSTGAWFLINRHIRLIIECIIKWKELKGI